MQQVACRGAASFQQPVGSDACIDTLNSPIGSDACIDALRAAA
jgi:hypothetical protein